MGSLSDKEVPEEMKRYLGVCEGFQVALNRCQLFPKCSLTVPPNHFEAHLAPKDTVLAIYSQLRNRGLFLEILTVKAFFLIASSCRRAEFIRKSPWSGNACMVWREASPGILLQPLVGARSGLLRQAERY